MALDTTHGPHFLEEAGLGAVRRRVARSFVQRLRGQIGRAPMDSGDALLLLKCSSIHTCFIRGALDIVYLDARFRICRVAPQLCGWRFSFGGRNAVHALELAGGSIDRLGLYVGQDLTQWLDPDGVPDPCARPVPGRFESGSAMVEFAVVAPVILAIGLGTLQYALMFFAKNQLTHASFMAGRAGTVDHANLSSVQEAYARALVPLYASGQDTASLAHALVRATADVAANTRIEILNPTRESFDDWSSAELQAKYGRRAIPNDGLSAHDPLEVKPGSGQNLQDANLIKLRLTHGYELKVPLAGTLMQYMLKWNDKGNDEFVTALYDRRRIPIVSHVTLLMQSDAVEPDSPVSTPGLGNGGKPVDPGVDPKPPKPPPKCQTISCSSPDTPSGPTDPGPVTCPGSVGGGKAFSLAPRLPILAILESDGLISSHLALSGVQPSRSTFIGRSS